MKTTPQKQSDPQIEAVIEKMTDAFVRYQVAELHKSGSQPIAIAQRLGITIGVVLAILDIPTAE